MKLDRIYKVFAKAGRVHLYDKLDESGNIIKQYVSDGGCIYALENLPIFTEGTLCSLLGVGSEKIEVENDVATDFCIEAMSDRSYDEDIPLKISTFEFFGQIVLTQLEGDEQVLHFVSPAYIKPFMDDPEITFISRNICGTRCVVIKNGMFTIGSIMPLRLVYNIDDYYIYSDITQAIYAELQRQKTGNRHLR